MTLCRRALSLFAAATLLAAGGWAMAQTAPAPVVLAPPAVSQAPATLPAVTIAASNEAPAVTTTSATAATHPAWVDAPLEPLVRGDINRVFYGHVDVVVLDGGLYEGLRTGTQCVVLRQGSPIAEIMIVASKAGKAAALVTKLGSEPQAGSEQRKDYTLLPGDQVQAEYYPAQ